VDVDDAEVLGTSTTSAMAIALVPGYGYGYVTGTNDLHDVVTDGTTLTVPATPSWEHWQL